MGKTTRLAQKNLILILSLFPGGMTESELNSLCDDYSDWFGKSKDLKIFSHPHDDNHLKWVKDNYEDTIRFRKTRLGLCCYLDEDTRSTVLDYINSIDVKSD